MQNYHLNVSFPIIKILSKYFLHNTSKINEIYSVIVDVAN